MKVTAKFYNTTETAKKSGFVANCSLCFDDVLVVKASIKNKKDGGKFVSYPSRKNGDEYIDLVYSMDSKLNDYIINLYNDWENSKNNNPYA